MEKPIEERLTERDRFANDVKSCCADLAETYCGVNSCVTCITDALMKMGYRKASDVAREIFAEIEQAQTEITDRLEEFIKEYKEYSESTVDYFGGKYEAMEVALRLVKSILTDKYADLKKKYESEGGE